MKITRNGSQPSSRGPADWFTGTVRIDAGFQGEAPGRVGGAATTAMQHIAVAEALDGKVVEWMEKVGDEEYGRGPGGR